MADRNWGALTSKPEGGDGTKQGSPSPQEKATTLNAPQGGTPGVKHNMQAPFLNIDTFTHWYRIKNVARVRVNGDICIALLGNGAQINTVTPEFIETTPWMWGLSQTSWADELSLQVWETPSLYPLITS